MRARAAALRRPKQRLGTPPKDAKWSKARWRRVYTKFAPAKCDACKLWHHRGSFHFPEECPSVIAGRFRRLETRMAKYSEKQEQRELRKKKKARDAFVRNATYTDVAGFQFRQARKNAKLLQADVAKASGMSVKQPFHVSNPARST